MRTCTIALCLALVLASSSDAGEPYPRNSLGPAALVQGLYGLSYERAVSRMFCINAMVCTSGDVDFIGTRLMLSRDDTAMLIRPSVGFCIVRGRASDSAGSDKSPWFGLIWPGIGINARTGDISIALNASAGYGANSPGGSLDDSFLTFSGALMYMF